MYSHSIRAAAVGGTLILFVITGIASPGRLRADSSQADSELEKSDHTCQPESSGAVLRCVLEHHPDIRVALGELKQLEAEVSRAGQRPNPELDTRVLGGGASFSAEAGISHTFETGGKRDARVNVAQQNLAIARSQALLGQHRLVAGSALRLLRLRQVREDTGLLLETKQTYARAVGRMRRRPALTSEQRVNLGTYEIAAGEAWTRSAAMRTEEIRLRTELGFATGLRNEQLDQALKQTITLRWPDPAQLADASENESEELRLARQRIARARAQLDLEEANAFPDFSIGPALEYRQGDEPSGGIFGGSSRSSDTEFGLSFQITLPLYHSNSGGQEAARAGLAAERLRESGVAAKMTAERASLVREYLLAVDALSRGFTKRQLQSRQRALRATILGGRVSPPAVIEFYRSLFEYRHSRHEREFAALRALLAIYSLDGRLLEKVGNDEIF